jgi:hypothetical protein
MRRGLWRVRDSGNIGEDEGFVGKIDKLFGQESFLLVFAREQGFFSGCWRDHNS